MYKPVIEKKEVNDEHYYWVDNKFTPGVTTILQETLPTPFALRQWIGDMGNEKAEAKLERAGARGSAIHHACETLLYGGELKLHEAFPDRKDQKCIVAFVNWLAEYQPEIVENGIEQVIASQLGYAGTLDILCKIKGELWIVDIKTSANVYDSHKLQLAAYQNAVYEMIGEKPKMGILHLNHKTKKGWAFHDDLEINGKPVTIDDFMKVFELYLVLNGGRIPEPPMMTVYPEVLSLKKQD
jgi:hypothetical protein